MSKKPRQEEDTGTWMNTYSDLVTLLLTFFVLLFSMSSVSAEKWESFVTAFSAHPGDDTAQVVLDMNAQGGGDEIYAVAGNTDDFPTGGAPSAGEPLPTDFNSLYNYLENYVMENNLSSSVQVSQGGESVVYIRFQNNIFFAPDRYEILPEAYETLSFVGDCLASVQDEIYLISINGHTAAVDYDGYGVSDWMLSSERASSVAIYLEDEKAIDGDKLRPMGYGNNYPVESNDTAEGRQHNRRVDMTIIRQSDGNEALLDSELASLFDPDEFPRTGGAIDILEPASGAEEDADS